MATTTTEKFVLEVDSKGAIKNLRSFNQEVQDVPKNVEKTSSSLGMLKGAFTALAASYATKKLFDFGTAIIQTGSKFETLGIQMKSVTGSSAAAEQAMKWITDFTVNTPYQLDQVSGAFVKLKAMGLDPMDGTMQAIADATSMLGGSMEAMDSIVLALGKSFTKGKMQAEELNMMAERGVPVYRLLSEQLGVTEQAIFKMSEKGQLGREAIQGLISGIQDWAGGASQNLMDTFAGKWSNLQDKITEMLNTLAKSGMLDAAKEAISSMIDALDRLTETGKLEDWGRKAGMVFGALGKAIEFTFTKAPLYIELFVNQASKFFAKVAEKFFEMNLKMMGGLQKIAAKMGVSFDFLDTIVDGLKTNIEVMTDLQSGATDAIDDTVEALLEMEKAKEKDIEKTAEQSIKNTTAIATGSRLVNTNKELADAIAIATNWATQHNAAMLNEAAAADVLNDKLEYIPENLGNIMQAQRMQGPLMTAFEPMYGELERGLSDAIYGAFTGGGTDSIMGAWEDFTANATSNFADSLSESLSSIFSGNTTAGQEFGFYRGANGQWKPSAGMAGLMGMAGGYLMQPNDQGEISTLGGVVGGGLQGYATTGNYVGAIIGAFVGGVQAMMTQDKIPNTSGINVGPAGTTQAYFGTGDYFAYQDDPLMQSLAGQLRGAYDAYTTGYRDIVQSFGDPELMEMLGKLPVLLVEGIDLSPQDAAKWAAEYGLNDVFSEWAGGAIAAGLEKMGLGQGAIDALGESLKGFAGKEQIAKLTDFVNTVVSLNKIITEGTIDAIDEQLAMDSTERFIDAFSQMGDAIDVATSNLDELDMLQRANELNDVVSIMQQAGASLAQLKQQAEGLRTSLSESIQAQIEGIQLEGMSKDQKIAYFRDSISSLTDQLANADSLEEVQKITQQLQQRYGQLKSELGDDLFSAFPTGPGRQSNMTWADWLTSQLEQLDEMASGQIDEVVAKGEEAYQELYDKALLAAQALGMFAEDFENYLDQKRNIVDPYATDWWLQNGGQNGGGGGTTLGGLFDSDPFMQTYTNQNEGMYGGNGGSLWAMWAAANPGLASRFGSIFQGTDFGINVEGVSNQGGIPIMTGNTNSNSMVIEVNVNVEGNQNLVTTTQAEAIVYNGISKALAPFAPGGVG